jgi:DUF4097 and DUF4098 domain-containing protein YvlB
MRSLLCSGVVAFACVSSSACVVGVDSQGQIVREEKRFTVEGTPEVRLGTFDGAIEIRSSEANQVLVEIEKRGPTREAVEALVVESNQQGQRITVEVKHPRKESFNGFGFNMSASARLIVTVPRRSDIVAKTGDGAIRLDSVNGRLELRTGDGSIRVADATGELVLNTGDGGITVDGAEGTLALETGDGGVNVEGKLSTVKMRTGDGSIVYRVNPGARMDDDWDISTGDGSVSLYLPGGFSADLDAHTGDGGIRNELGVEDLEKSADRDHERERDKKRLRARLGDGGHRLRIETGDGAITLKAR